MYILYATTGALCFAAGVLKTSVVRCCVLQNDLQYKRATQQPMPPVLQPGTNKNRFYTPARLPAICWPGSIIPFSISNEIVISTYLNGK